MSEIRTDVVVVGAGNAALCAAMAARDEGADVVVLERAPEAERGGNSAYTGGGMRCVYAGVEDLLELVPDLSADELERTDFGSYTEEQFFDDIATVTQYRADPDMAELLVRGSLPTMRWMRDKGIRFVPAFRRHSFTVDGRNRFSGNPVAAAGGGAGLVEAWMALADQAGVRIHYRTRATELLRSDAAVAGVRCVSDGTALDVHAGAVVLAAGGFQANAEWRTRYLGRNWDLAKVRGTRYNTGDGIQMALDAGAMPYGNWSGCHAVGWDRNAPDFGDIRVGDGFSRHGYPLGVVVNARGERFLDEGADLRQKTYAKYGALVLEQPGQLAWQIFDAKVADLLLPSSYRQRQMTRVTADSLEELVGKLEGVDPEACLRTLHEFNAAVRTDRAFNPAVKDDLGTVGLPVPKSNWAQALDEPPFEAFAITCGITFTFGGVRIDGDGAVVDQECAPIPGLYAAGEMVGGVFYFNYPGGSGLTWGAVTGRAAGRSAGLRARTRAPA